MKRVHTHTHTKKTQVVSLNVIGPQQKLRPRTILLTSAFFPANLSFSIVKNYEI